MNSETPENWKVNLITKSEQVSTDRQMVEKQEQTERTLMSHSKGFGFSKDMFGDGVQ